MCTEPETIAAGNDEAVETKTDSTTWVWSRPRDGWQVGARLLSSSKFLQPGDPAVFQYVLKNVADEEQTIVLFQYDNSHPVLGDDNRISLNILGSSSRKHQHRIAAGETLELRQYRITISTEGLLPGEYTAYASPPLWRTVKDKPNRGSGIGGGLSISFVVGSPDDTKLSKIPSANSEEEQIYWGKPVAGLVVGMRLPDGRRTWPNNSQLEAEMYVRNLSQKTIELEYDVPQAADWNTHVRTPDGKFVRLDSVWYTGTSPRVTRKLTVRPFEQARLFESADEQKLHGPRLQLLSEQTEYQPGDPKRLISDGDDFMWVAHVTIRQSEIRDLTTIVGSSAVPFTVESQ